MIHAYGLGSFGLPGIDGKYATSYGLGHICSRIDRNHYEADRPYALEHVTEKVRYSVINEYSLEYHGRTPEDLYIDAYDDAYKAKKDPLQYIVCFADGNGLKYAAYKTYETSYGRGRYGQDQGVLGTVEIDLTVSSPKTHYVSYEL